MGFERGKGLKETLNIGRVKEAYHGFYIRTTVEADPIYYYGMAKKGHSPSKVSLGIVMQESDFIQGIQQGKTIPLREHLIKRAKKLIDHDLKKKHFTIDPNHPPHFSFKNNEIFICKGPGDEINIERIYERDVVFDNKFYRYPEDLSLI